MFGLLYNTYASDISSFYSHCIYVSHFYYNQSQEKLVSVLPFQISFYISEILTCVCVSVRAFVCVCFFNNSCFECVLIYFFIYKVIQNCRSVDLDGRNRCINSHGGSDISDANNVGFSTRCSIQQATNVIC